MDRPTSRRLLFDAQGLLGRVDDGKGLRATIRTPEGPVVELGFSGVHAVAPALLDRITETGTFSILDTYLRLAGEGARILPFRVDGCTWIDIGKNADLERAELPCLPGRGRQGGIGRRRRGAAGRSASASGPELPLHPLQVGLSIGAGRFAGQPQSTDAP